MQSVNVCHHYTPALQDKRELSVAEIDAVAGGMNDWTTGGIAVIGLGVAGGLATAGFGLAIGGAMLFLGYASGGSSGSSKYVSQ